MKDGCFAVSGYTNSTDGHVRGNHGSFDIWVLKIDSGIANREQGIIFNQCYGGSGSDISLGRSIIETKDGNLAVIGYTNSIDGDFSEKTRRLFKAYQSVLKLNIMI